MALQGLCCLDVQGERAMDLVRQFIDDSDEQPSALAAAHKLLAEAFAHRAESDELLARHAKHWDLSRLALVDRNILRLAASELRDHQTPPKVVITEAIYLAREFSTSESARFVNGVLDAVMRELALDVPAADEPTESGESDSAPSSPNSEIGNLPTGQAGPKSDVGPQ